jgi:hypothetical protein
MLSGVDDDLREGSIMSGSMDRREFRKVWTRTNNVKKFHFRANRRASSRGCGGVSDTAVSAVCTDLPNGSCRLMSYGVRSAKCK